jgi:hypothetical protein
MNLGQSEGALCTLRSATAISKWGLLTSLAIDWFAPSSHSLRHPDTAGGSRSGASRCRAQGAGRPSPWVRRRLRQAGQPSDGCPTSSAPCSGVANGSRTVLDVHRQVTGISPKLSVAQSTQVSATGRRTLFPMLATTSHCRSRHSPRATAYWRRSELTLPPRTPTFAPIAQSRRLGTPRSARSFLF